MNVKRGTDYAPIRNVCVKHVDKPKIVYCERYFV